MTTLKGIKGDQIRYLDQDPVVQGVAGGTWSSGGSLNTARYINRGTTGSAISGLQCGGTTPSSTYGSATEEWTAATLNSTLTVS